MKVKKEKEQIVSPLPTAGKAAQIQPDLQRQMKV